MATPTATARSAAQPVNSSTDRARALTAVACAVSAALAGCASGSKLSTIPSDGPTMAEIYRQHMSGTKDRAVPADPRPRVHPGVDAPAPDGRYRHTVSHDIDSRFVRLPNPDLVMYVAPHLSHNGRYPIPGYSTVFPMYESVEYAMPGETRWRDPLAEAPLQSRTVTAAAPPVPRAAEAPRKTARRAPGG
jgi:conjugative transfer region lipoprotein (TIGR03751 family)